MFGIKILITLLLTIKTVMLCSSTSNTLAPSDEKLPNFQSEKGLITLRQRRSQDLSLIYSKKYFRYRQYNITVQFTQYEVAISLLHIQNYYNPNGLEFMIRPISRPKIFIICVSMPERIEWTMVNMLFVVSARQEIRVGTFIADNPEFLKVSQNSRDRQIAVSKVIDKKFSKEIQRSPLKAEVFIIGIKCYDKAFDLYVTKTQAFFDSNSINATIIYSKNIESPIQSLLLSYIIYIDMNNPINIQVMRDPSRWIMGYLETLDNRSFDSIGPNKNVFGGFTAIKIDPKSFNFGENEALKGLNQVDMKNLRSFMNSFDLKLLFFNSKQIFKVPLLTYAHNILQSTAGAKEDICYTFSECVKAGNYFVSKNNNKFCIECKINAQYDENRGVCLCGKDYKQDKLKNCVAKNTLCGQNQVYLNDKCYIASVNFKNSDSCGQNFYYNQITNECQCKLSYISYIKNKKIICRPQCQKNQQFNYQTQLCQCPSNNRDIFGNCIHCKDQLSIWNDNTKKCQCIPNTQSIFNKCLTCSQFSTYNKQTKSCTCNHGYQGNGIICRKINQFQSTITINFENI